MSATTGLTDDHRRVYDLLVNRHKDGLTRDQLTMRTGLDDRTARGIIEDLRTIAAINPHPDLGPVILGFDPQHGVYTYAKDRHQADRILAYQFTRVRSLVAPLLAQLDAARDAFGETTAPPAYQEDLFRTQRVMRAFR